MRTNNQMCQSNQNKQIIAHQLQINEKNTINNDNNSLQDNIRSYFKSQNKKEITYEGYIDNQK